MRPRMPMEQGRQMTLPPLPPVFTTEEARALGISPYYLTQLVRSGRVRRIRKATYAVAETVTAHARGDHHLLLARISLTQRGPHHALSHLSAAAAHGLPLPLGMSETVHLTSLSGTARTRRASGLWVHHADSSETEVDLVGTLLTTTASRTVADCLRHFPPRTGVPIADAALHRRLTTGKEVLAQLNMQCHWTGRAKFADAATPLVDGRRESWLESYAAVLFSEWGVDPPTPQLIIVDAQDRFVARADAGWQEDATVIELDGKSKYLIPSGTAEVDPEARWEMEKDRYDRIGNLGVERIRFGLSHLHQEAVMVQRRIHDRRAAGSVDRFTGSFHSLPDSGLVIPSIWDLPAA